ncbi:MAG: DoxX family protein [Marinibacterium sp.]
MKSLIASHNAVFAPLDRHGALITPTLARIVFLLVLFFYYWNSAMLKFDGSVFTPSAGAFGQMFPKAAEAVLYDVSQLTFVQRIVIFLGTVAEIVLPVLILIGLFTRLAALGMIGFVLVQTLVDVTGHGVGLGAFFDSAQGLIDQRTMWIFLLLVLVVQGAGPLSLDRLLKLS